MAASTTGQGKGHKAYLSVSTNVYFLFKDWNLNSAKGLLVAILLTSLLAILHEIIIYLLYLDQSLAGRNDKRTCGVGFLSLHVRRSIMYLLHVGLAYILMLSAMSYNIWILLAISVGSGLGYLLSRPVLRFLFLRRLGSQTPTSADRLPKKSRDHSKIPLVKHCVRTEASSKKSIFNSENIPETYTTVADADGNVSEMDSPPCEINSTISASLPSKRTVTFSDNMELNPLRGLNETSVT
ncbi:unnamed protein product [Lymnaea stagnalis]|uniref:Copper transport protein n=1 Tax=Lymnaea stagnalis TaxID=6523 RepID=A0AAV2HV09_LYMST